jgi:peptide/nickel transport system permease protein
MAQPEGAHGMSETVVDEASSTHLAPVQRGAWRSLLRQPLAVAGIVILAVVIIGAVVGPFLVPWDPMRADPASVLLPPWTEHVLGTDASGRDILARLLVGARLTLSAAVLVFVLALGIGVPAGLLAGYFGGWFDAVSSWVAAMTLSLPSMVVVLAFVAILGPDTYTSMAIFGVLFSVGPFRLTRSTVRTVRGELYIDAARVSGVSESRIVFRHILAAVRGPVIVQAAAIAGIAIVLQAGLDFLGVGDRSQPTWGQMLSDAFVAIYRAPTNILWPGLAIGLTGAALTLLANALRDTLQSGRSQPVPSPRPKARASRSTADRRPAEFRPVDDGELLRVRDLSVALTTSEGERIVVDSVSLDVAKGTVLGVVGASGSGKTQTALAILGLLSPIARVTTGTVTLVGEPIWTTRGMRGKRIGYIPQEPLANLDPAFTVGHTLVEPLRRHLKLSRREARARALALLERVGIRDPERTFHAYPHQISGGMAQRVLIAAAVSCDPELIVADEPTTALDVTVQADILDLLRDLQRERNLGILLITHNIGVVADLCDHVLVMSDGRIVDGGITRDVLADSRHPTTRLLLEAALEDASPRAIRDEVPT